METKAAYSQPLYLHLPPLARPSRSRFTVPSHNFLYIRDIFIREARNKKFWKPFPGLHCSITSILDLSIFEVEEANVKYDQRYPNTLLQVNIALIGWYSEKNTTMN